MYYLRMVIALKDGRLTWTSISWSKDRDPTANDWRYIRESIAYDLDNGKHEAKDLTIVSFSIFPQL